MKKGFTLIELLIVIGILAILSVVTVVTLNPVRFFQEARDSQRISDLNTMKSALLLYLSSVTGADLQSGNGVRGAFTCAGNFGATIALATKLVDVGGVKALAHAADLGVDGGGWIAVKFTDMGVDSPLSALPRDPLNTVASSYQYACAGVVAGAQTFELAGVLESDKYKTTQDLDGTDGGNNANAYEVGTNVQL